MPSSLPPTRVVYSREQLLALEPLATTMTLQPESVLKFDVIEIGDPVPTFKRRDPERVDGPSPPAAAAAAAAATNGSGSRGIERDERGGNGAAGGEFRRPEDRRDDRFARPVRTSGGKERGGAGCFGRGVSSSSGGGGGGGSGGGGTGAGQNDRFFGISRDGREACGANRNQETFDEGVKYELERNAEHMRRIQETLDKEGNRNERDHDRDSAKAASQSHEDHGRDEIERLLAAVSDESRTGNTRRSRFFSDTTAQSDAPAPSSVPSAAGPSYGSGNQWKADNSMWSTAPTANVAAGGPNPACGVNLGGITIAGGVANLDTHQLHSQQQQQHPQLSAADRLRATAGGRAPAAAASSPDTRAPALAPTVQVWRAQDIEQMLKSGNTAQLQNPATAAAAAKSSSHVSPAPAPKPPINASDLESMLIQQARGGAAPQTPPQQPSPPQQQQQRHQHQRPAGFSLGAPSQGYAPASSGSGTPPQQLSASLQGQPLPANIQQQQWIQMMQQQQAAVAAAVKMPVQQQQPQVPAGMGGYPMMMNAQGQPVAVTPAQQQQLMQMLQAQQQQQQAAAAAMYARQDGSHVYMQPGVSPFATNAQFLYQQQLQQLQLQQQQQLQLQQQQQRRQ